MIKTLFSDAYRLLKTPLKKIAGTVKDSAKAGVPQKYTAIDRYGLGTGL
jgi:hypothetical protein